MKVIREPEVLSESQTNSVEEEDLPDNDGNNWKCNLCDFKCVLKNAMSTHVANIHSEKTQFKCNLCTFKTNNNIEPHLNIKHPTELNTDFTSTYQRIKGLKNN